MIEKLKVTWEPKFQQLARPDYLRPFPIPCSLSKIPPSKVEQKAIADLVSHILAAKLENGEADTSALEYEIDKRVYRLYGLTPEEIKIVESRNK